MNNPQLAPEGLEAATKELIAIVDHFQDEWSFNLDGAKQFYVHRVTGERHDFETDEDADEWRAAWAVHRIITAYLRSTGAVAPEPVAWPTERVNIPEPFGTGARIIGFRIREGDAAWGKYGLSEPLTWLERAIAAHPAPADTGQGGRVEELEAALAELVDSLEPAERVPPRDPAYGDEVRALGARIGFGALMASASYEWRAWLAENGYPLGSEFVSGPCRAVLESDLRAARAALNAGART